MSELICPKCHGAMRQYERGGVTIDQCTDCRGIFLDRGELERMVDAETRWHGEQSAPPPAAGHQQAPPPPGYGYDRGHGSGGGYRQGHGSGGGYRQGHGSGGGYRQGQGQGHRRKRSFLDDLFD